MKEKELTSHWLKTDTQGVEDINVQDLQVLQEFILAQWRERSQERQLNIPQDTSSACKFVSLFIKIQFGGKIVGNSNHQFNDINGQLVDLCRDNQDVALMKDPWLLDSKFIGNAEHLASMKSCLGRVLQWQTRYCSRGLKNENSI